VTKKKILIMIVLLALPFTGFAARRMVLAELFTSTTCPPCVAGNLTLTNKLAEHMDLIAVRYHMYWPSPGNDPFYHYNTVDNSTRRYYYGDISGVPNQKVDGFTFPVMDYFIEERMNIEPTVAMKGWCDFQTVVVFDAEQGYGTAYLELTNEESVATSRRVFAALVESNVEYKGTNGDPIHHEVLISMFSEPNGVIVSLDAGETKVVEYEFTVYDTIPILDGASNPTEQVHVVDASNCEIVFWFQNDATKEVLNATVAPLHGPLSAEVSGSLVDNPEESFHPGEESDFYVTLLNTSDWNWEEVTAILTTEDELVDIIDSTGTWTDVLAGEEGINDSDSFRVMLSTQAEDGYRPDMTLHLSCGKGPAQNIEAEFKVYEPTGVAEDIPFSYTVSTPSVLREEGLISLSLRHSSATDIFLFDAAGRKVATIYSGELSAGLNIVPVSTDKIAEGVYFIKIVCNGHVKVEKTLVLD